MEIIVAAPPNELVRSRPVAFVQVETFPFSTQTGASVFDI